MNVNLHINATYNATHSHEIGQLYGFTPIKRSISYNISINIPKEHSRDEDNLKQTLTAAGICSGIINKIMESVKQIKEDDDTKYHSKMLETIHNHISLNPSRENSSILNLIIIGNSSNSDDNQENSPIVRNRPDIAALSVVYESSYISKVSGGDEQPQPINPKKKSFVQKLLKLFRWK
jgi:hypothetical protein